MVDAAGFEPAVPEAADLQSTGVTNFPTHPFNYFGGSTRIRTESLTG